MDRWGGRIGVLPTMLRVLLVGILLSLLGIPAHAVPGDVLFRSDFDVWDGSWQVHERKNVVWIASGQLVLGLEKRGDRVRMARVDTEDTFTFTYGTARFRMRFMGPRGAHSAGWVHLVGDYYITGQSEINVAEHLGANKRVWQNVYWCPCIWPNPQVTRTPVELDPRAWHVYEVDWTPLGYTFKVDGLPTAVIIDGLSALPHQLVLSYLISPWERDKLDRDHLGRYRTYVDWVEVRPNAWTH